MENLNVLWVLLGLAILVVGPASGVWSGILVKGLGDRLDAMAKNWDEERKDLREWLKSLQHKADSNATDIAVLKDRTDRE